MSGVGAVSRGAYIAPSMPGAAGLDAQKARVAKQLADCVNCTSASTPEGKARIEQLSSQLRAVEARIQKAADVHGAVSAP